jgi:hypothetical protein
MRAEMHPAWARCKAAPGKKNPRQVRFQWRMVSSVSVERRWPQRGACWTEAGV